MTLACFKAYDIRGRLGDQLNDDIAYRIGRAYGQLFQPRSIALGSDIRLTSESLKMAVARGLMDAGVDVVDLGMTGTEEVYFAAFHLDVDGGIEVTASHNPIDYNGMKIVKQNAQPISGDSGLKEIQYLAESQAFVPSARQGQYSKTNILSAYVDHLLTYIDLTALKPLKIVVNAGNGAAGHVIDEIESRFNQAQIPVQFIKVHHEADGTFPNGIPNPILIENREATTQAVLNHQADLGIAWDGDFDRCFFFDHKGQFIEGYYIVGLLAQAFLVKSPHEKIIHDPRLTWNTIDIANQYQGIAVQCKTGHAFIKERMRLENAVYGGEMSAHHYFRDFAYCDSGMIPWLLVIEMLCVQGKTLADLICDRMDKFPCSGEINFTVQDAPAILDRILQHYAPMNPTIDRTDGMSLEFEDWRVNVRSSNTEPLLRLNIESKKDCRYSIQNLIDELRQLITT